VTDRIVVGRIGRAHGLAGELYVRSESDTPGRFRAGAVFVTDEASPRQLEIRSSRRHNERLLVTFAGISDRSAAESLRDVALTIGTADRRQLADDEFWPDELIGLVVRDVAGEPVGMVIRVDTGGPQDRLIVQSDDGREATVPFVRDLVPEVSIAGGWVTIDFVEGLLNPPPA
jgi:16S rRNA processing protein RimM